MMFSSDKELEDILQADSPELFRELWGEADKVRRQYYSNSVYIRGLIEFTNYCKNDCYYCGVRKSNAKAVRYRLSKEEILECCKRGYALGFRTFVLQGGEDPYFTDERICDIVGAIRQRYEDCAITLSIGEKSRESYLSYYKSGANRYLLRQESASAALYSRLHPKAMSLQRRKRCLFSLKEIGYQVGGGFMVGAPYQTIEDIIADLRFLEQLQPSMIGIGPFIPSCNTPFALYPAGSVWLTLRLISLLRLMFPTALIPATTSLATLNPNARFLALRCGANVVMPNLTPFTIAEHYALYENKLHTGLESAYQLNYLKESILRLGYEVVIDRGDAVSV